MNNDVMGGRSKVEGKMKLKLKMKMKMKMKMRIGKKTVVSSRWWTVVERNYSAQKGKGKKGRRRQSNTLSFSATLP